MSKRESKLYQDQLYGAKVLSPLAVAILDTPELQRLEGLKQLGFSNVTYRGAHHTRLEHSVGTYFATRTIMRRIVQNHERLGMTHPALLRHPGFDIKLSDRLTMLPENAGLPDNHSSAQSSWRGLTEVVSIAGLLHDIGHAPFGHTLEDEFTGLYERHDSLAGPRLFTMLFDERSHLARVFSDDRHEPWLPRLANAELARLIYLLLSWKEKIDPTASFDALVRQRVEDLTPKARTSTNAAAELSRLTLLQEAHAEFLAAGLFQPYMSDIIGNTICADLLDYLPRDRMNLGMSWAEHKRIQRYFTIREGTLREGEGLRLSILVTRNKHGGQRRDVATSILAIMRERYEMAERVYYHHKKAAASAMLVKLLELVPLENRPRDDDRIYPAPWSDGDADHAGPPHLVHLSDDGLMSYLSAAAVGVPNAALQRELGTAIRYRRDRYYRTLLVLDQALVRTSGKPVEYFTTELRRPETGEPGAKRRELELKLAMAGEAPAGSVIIYCPSQRMQAKEVDVRTEIQEGSILPLRRQDAEFAYQADLDVLARYYQELWRCYLFVSGELFRDPVRCKAVVDAFAEHFGLDRLEAYRKVRTHTFRLTDEEAHAVTMRAVSDLLDGLSFKDLPADIMSALLKEASEDGRLLEIAKSTRSREAWAPRLEELLGVTVLGRAIDGSDLDPTALTAARKYRDELRAGEKRMSRAAREGSVSYATFEAELLAEAQRIGKRSK